jgi:hypothetical protein
MMWLMLFRMMVWLLIALVAVHYAPVAGHWFAQRLDLAWTRALSAA